MLNTCDKMNHTFIILTILGIALVASGSTQIVLEVNQTQHEIKNIMNLKNLHVRIMVENVTITDKLTIEGLVNLTLPKHFKGRLYVEVKWGNLTLYNTSIGPEGWINHHFNYTIPLETLREHQGENLTIIARYHGENIGLHIVSKTYKLDQLAEFFKLFRAHVNEKKINSTYSKIIITLTSKAPVNKLPVNIVINGREYHEQASLAYKKTTLTYTVKGNVDYVKVSIPYINYTLYEGEPKN